MDYSRKKLPKESMEDLSRLEVGAVKPFSLMVSPVYVFLRANEKFVSVKAPLDFFIPSEIERMRVYEYFYLPSFFNSVSPFRSAGKLVKSLITQGPDPVTRLPPSPLEISASVLSVIGSLWSGKRLQGGGIEPFLVTVFVNELCDPFPSEILQRAREKSVDTYDRALLRSSWAVFLALHLGYCDLEFLNHLWVRTFCQDTGEPASFENESEVDELIILSIQAIANTSVRIVKTDFFKRRPERISQKVEARLEKISKEFINQHRPPPSIYGDEGFIDV